MQEKIGHVEPEKLLLLSDDEMKACYFSRQKTVYARELAKAFVGGELILEKCPQMSDEQIRFTLKKIKGIGNWTVDVFLMMALHRSDCFPFGDIALIKSIQEVKDLSKSATKEEIIAITEKWRPYRTIAAFILWHAYIKKRNIAL